VPASIAPSSGAAATAFPLITTLPAAARAMLNNLSFITDSPLVSDGDTQHPDAPPPRWLTRRSVTSVGVRLPRRDSHYSRPATLRHAAPELLVFIRKLCFFHLFVYIMGLKERSIAFPVSD
jgi:hypothetical protein